MLFITYITYITAQYTRKSKNLLISEFWLSLISPIFILSNIYVFNKQKLKKLLLAVKTVNNGQIKLKEWREAEKLGETDVDLGEQSVSGGWGCCSH